MLQGYGRSGGAARVDAKTIAWVLPHEGYDDETVIAPLREQGFRVLVCVAGEAPPAEVGGDDLVVLIKDTNLFGQAVKRGADEALLFLNYFFIFCTFGNIQRHR